MRLIVSRVFNYENKIMARTVRKRDPYLNKFHSAEHYAELKQRQYPCLYDKPDRIEGLIKTWRYSATDMQWKSISCRLLKEASNSAHRSRQKTTLDKVYKILDYDDYDFDRTCDLIVKKLIWAYC